MIQCVQDRFALHPPKEVENFLRLLRIVTSRQQYEELVQQNLGGLEYPKRKGLLNNYHFNMEDLCLLLCAIDPEKAGVRISTVKILLGRLIEWGLVFDNEMGEFNRWTRFTWASTAIGVFDALCILDNVLLGRQHIVKKYSPSISAIIVEKNGDQQIGTGFFVQLQHGGQHSAGDGYVVTAKHNVDPADDIQFVEFTSSSNIKFESRSSEWVLHPDLDMAAIPVVCNSKLVPIFPLGEPGVLSPIISIGYPKISTTDGPYLLAHSGELNATVRSYIDNKDYLLISNGVSPGSSGSPVLDHSGLCVGMVVRSLETKYEGGLTATSAAIPAAAIQDFIEALHGPRT